MTNREIRSKAYGLFRTRYREMLPAMAIIQLINFLPQMASALLQTGVASTAAVYALQVVLAPVTAYGLARYLLKIADGDAPDTGLLFAHLMDSGLVLRIWLAALAYNGLTQIYIAGTNLITGNASGGSAGFALALVALILIGMPIFLWLTMRLNLFQYAMVLDPNGRPGEWLTVSWRAMRHNVWRWFRLMLSLMWPLILILAIQIPLATQIRLMRESGAVSLDSVAAKLLPPLLASLLTIFFWALPMLGVAVFGRDLLEGRAKSACVGK